jgi:hypothetical protein
MTGAEPSDTEAIFVRFDAGEEAAAISLDREVFENGIAHEDGAITLQLGGVRREGSTGTPAQCAVRTDLAGGPRIGSPELGP